MLSALAADERDPAQDPHRAQRDDERVHAQPDHHRAVEDAGTGDRSTPRHERERDASPSAPCGCGAAGTIAIADARQRVDRPDRQIDPGGDDDDRGAHRHDREEARVGRGLDQRVRVEEVVDGRARERIDVVAGQQAERDGEPDDDQQQTGLLRTKQAPEDDHGGGRYYKPSVGVSPTAPNAPAGQRQVTGFGADLVHIWMSPHPWSRRPASILPACVSDAA